MSRTGYLLYFWIGFFIWFLPAIRNFNSRYRYYFLLIAISDPILLFTGMVLKIPSSFIVYVPIAYLYVLSFCWHRINEWVKYIVLALLPIHIYLIKNNLTNAWFNDYSMIILHGVVFCLLLHLFVVEYNLVNRFNFFMATVLFFELTIVTKFSWINANAKYSFELFYITSTLSFIVALYWGVFKEDPVFAEKGIGKF